MTSDALPSDRIGLISARVHDVDVTPENYAQFLHFARARRDDFVGAYPGAMVMRGVNRSAGIWCKIPFAVADQNYVDFEPNDLIGPSVRLGDGYGAATVQTMLWGKSTALRVLSARTLLGARTVDTGMSREDRYRRLAYAGAVEVKDFPFFVRTGSSQPAFDPKAQARLLIAIQRNAPDVAKWTVSKGRDVDDAGTSDTDARLKPAVLQMLELLRGVDYTPHRHGDGVEQRGEKLDFTAFHALAVLTGDVEGARPSDTGEWSIAPVLLPLAYQDEIEGFSITIVARRVGYPLDSASMQRFTLAFEHVLAHFALLRHLRKFVTFWWSPLLETSFWEEKRTAAISFLRAWQRHATTIDPLWQLGAGDPYADPELVHALSVALRLESAWIEECRRISDLLRFSCEIVDDGDPRVLL